MSKSVTGTIIALAGGRRTGTIRGADGARIRFSAGVVLGDFEALAVGHRVSYDLDPAWPHDSAARVLREPLRDCAPPENGAPPDLRYGGFEQRNNIRLYRFEAVHSGHSVGEFVVSVDLALLLEHHIGVQEAPALCLRKLAADLKRTPGGGTHQLDKEDLLAYASARIAALERKRARHGFAARRGTPPPLLGSH